MAKTIITIDGPAGVGKSATAKMVAEKLGAAFLDTGATYRAATLAAMNKLDSLADTKAIAEIIDRTKFDFQITENQITVKINNQDVTEQIRSAEVTSNVKFIASAAELRNRLVKMQRDFAGRYEKIVTEGRDQGTVVFPGANVKIFLTAKPAQRAKRRAEQLMAKGHKVDIVKLQADIEARDASDRNRPIAPLTAAKEAVIIDNTNLTLERTVGKIVNIAKKNI